MPSSWGTSADGAVAGFVACGTFDDESEVAWTDKANLLLVTAQGFDDQDLASLYQWWLGEA